MRKEKFAMYMAPLAAAMLLGACSSEEPAQQTPGLHAIRLTSNVATRSANLDLQRTQIAAGVQVGVFVQGDNAAVSSNAVLTADGNGALTGDAGNYPETGTVSIYAYAPYNSSWSYGQANQFGVATDQSLDAGYLASDLLYGVPAGENAIAEQQEAVVLNFTHKLAKVNVKVNAGTSDAELNDASVSILGTKTQTTLNPADGSLGEASGLAAEIKAVKIAAENIECAGSAIIVPQTVEAGEFAKVSLADGRDIVASLAAPVEFKSGKSYTYTVNLAGKGPTITASIFVATSVTDWEEDEVLAGDGQEKIVYGVGDYVMKDGSLMKAAALKAADADVQANACAVIFSTTVSEADALAGYAGYAVSLGGRKGNTQWYAGTEEATQLRGSVVSTVADAINCLDGLYILDLVKETADWTTIYKAFDFTNYSKSVMGFEAANLTGWFTPSIGQLFAILNNLGEAGITSEIALSGKGEYESDGGVEEIISKINSHALADQQIVAADVNAFYATSTETTASTFWGVTLNGADKSNFKISRQAGKTGSNRSVLPCVAYKLQ